MKRGEIAGSLVSTSDYLLEIPGNRKVKQHPKLHKTSSELELTRTL